MDSLRFMDFRVQTFIKRKLDCDIQCRPLSYHVMVVQVFLHWLVNPWSNKTKEPARRKVARLQKTRWQWRCDRLWPRLSKVVASNTAKARLCEFGRSQLRSKSEGMTQWLCIKPAFKQSRVILETPPSPYDEESQKSKQQGSEGKELIMWSILALTSPNSAHIAFVICPTRW